MAPSDMRATCAPGNSCGGYAGGFDSRPLGATKHRGAVTDTSWVVLAISFILAVILIILIIEHHGGE